MSVSTVQESVILNAYSLVKHSGLLETSLGRRLFKSAYFLYKRYLEDNLQDLIQAFPSLLSGGNVLDIGANIGYTADVLARATDPGCKVYAFEPELFNFKILQQTSEAARFKNKIVALQCAVGAENGTINLWLNDRHHADHRIITEQFRATHPESSGATVAIVSIDSFLENHPGPVSFAKIDVQGYELAVLKGMQRTLEANHDITIVLEYMPAALRDLGFEPSQLISFLVDRGFQIYLVRPHGKLQPGMPAVEDSGYVDLVFSRRSLEFGRAA